jgi:hypothetical protein
LTKSYDIRGEKVMEKITKENIGACIQAALDNNEKNILFVSKTLEYENAIKWFESHPEYYICRSTPAPVYEEKNGLLVKAENYYAIEDSVLNKANDEKAIWFHHAFGDESLVDFDGFLKILKERSYTNTFPGGIIAKHSLEKLALFVAFTSPTKGDWARLDESHYDLFDKIYVLD